MGLDKKLYYLASPYSHKNPSIRKQRAEDVTSAAVSLLRQGVFTFAPIAYNEPWEKHNLPGDWTFWCDFDKAFIARCDGGIIVLMLDGWENSVGVSAEVEYAKSLNLPIYYATKEQIDSGDLSFLENVAESRCTLSLFCQNSKL